MPKSLFGWRHVVAATIGLAMIAGCSTKPPATSPAPQQGVTVPVQPDLGNPLDPSNVQPAPAALPPAAIPAVPVAPVLAAPVLGMTAGTPVPLIPFVSKINGHTKLFVFDRTIADNYALPGAGEDIQNPTLFSNSRIVFERETSGHGYGRYGSDYDRGRGQIWFYDVVAELLVSFNDVNGLGSVRRPSISFDGTVMTFLLEDKARDFVGRAMIWINGVVADLAKVNAVGDLHGGITWIRISCDARWAVFTTADGRLFVYDIINPLVHEITDAQDVNGRHSFASHPAISPDGTQIAWADASGFVYRYDRIADLVDPMPFLNLAFNAEFVTDPMWLCWDNAHIYAELFTYGATQEGIAYRTRGHRYVTGFGFGDDSQTLYEFDGAGYENYSTKREYYKVKVFPSVWRVVEYNWITETVGGLTILNNVLGEGVQLISDLEESEDDRRMQ